MINDLSFFHSTTINTSMLIKYSRILENIISSHSQRLNSTTKSIFDLKSSPGVTLLSYIDRLVKFCEIDEKTMIYSLLLIDQFCRRQQEIKLSNSNIYLVMLSSLYISVKMLHDVIFEHGVYAKISGITTKRLTELESLFLEVLDFKVHVEDRMFVLFECSFWVLS